MKTVKSSNFILYSGQFLRFRCLDCVTHITAAKRPPQITWISILALQRFIVFIFLISRFFTILLVVFLLVLIATHKMIKLHQTRLNKALLEESNDKCFVWEREMGVLGLAW